MLKWLLALTAIAGSILSNPAAAQTYDASSFRIAGKGGKNKPFVIVVPGSGGNIPGHWMSALAGAGYGVVGINLGGIFGRPLYGVSEQTLAYAVAKAVDAGKEAGFDVNRYAVLGLSKGGTVALISPSYVSSHPAPKALFAFYPGSLGSCPVSASGSTKVHIFYGDADEWGNFRGTRQACAGRAGGNVQYHEYPGAHHGFDGGSSGSFSCCGGQFRYQPNGAAKARAMGIVRRELAAMR